MRDFSNFGSLKSTETAYYVPAAISTNGLNFSNFGSLKSTETGRRDGGRAVSHEFQQFRLVEEH